MVTKTLYFISLTQHNFLRTLSICRPLKSAARGGRPVGPPITTPLAASDNYALTNWMQMVATSASKTGSVIA